MIQASSTIIDRVLQPFADVLTEETARALVELRADSQAQERIDELAAKSNDGTITTDEQAEYQSIVNAIDVISLLQLKARVYLQEHEQVDG